jgi:hypothetical protein
MGEALCLRRSQGRYCFDLAGLLWRLVAGGEVAHLAAVDVVVGDAATSAALLTANREALTEETLAGTN